LLCCVCCLGCFCGLLWLGSLCLFAWLLFCFVLLGFGGFCCLIWIAVNCLRYFVVCFAVGYFVVILVVLVCLGFSACGCLYLIVRYILWFGRFVIISAFSRNFLYFWCLLFCCFGLSFEVFWIGACVRLCNLLVSCFVLFCFVALGWFLWGILYSLGLQFALVWLGVYRCLWFALCWCVCLCCYCLGI